MAVATVMAAPALPTTIRVGAVEYTVTQDRDEWMKIEHETQTKGYYGHSHHKDAKIYLNPDAAESVTRLTLLHEVLHCLTESAMGAPVFDTATLGEERDDREERIVRMFEAPLLNVLRDNPELVAYLTA